MFSRTPVFCSAGASNISSGSGYPVQPPDMTSCPYPRGQITPDGVKVGHVLSMFALLRPDTWTMLSMMNMDLCLLVGSYLSVISRH